MPQLTAATLAREEYPDFYHTYVSRVPARLSLADALADSLAQLNAYFDGLAPERYAYAYAPGKWTVAQALQHVVDTERIFAYRALRIARADATPLPGFDQDAFVAAGPQNPDVHRLLEEFTALRKSSRLLFAGLDADALARTGTMSGGGVSVAAIGFILSGHVYHHAALYRERYGDGEREGK